MLTELNPPRVFTPSALKVTTDFMCKLDALAAPEESLPLLKGSFKNRCDGFLLKVTNAGSVFISDCDPPIDSDQTGGAWEQCNSQISPLLYAVDLAECAQRDGWSLFDLPPCRSSGFKEFLTSSPIVREGIPTANQSPKPNKPIRLIQFRRYRCEQYPLQLRRVPVID